MNRIKYLLAALVLVTAGNSGCVVESVTRSGEPPGASAGAPTIGAAPARSGDRETPDDPASTSTRFNRVVAEVLPLGTVPYDNMTLPLVSPDARFVVTQTGMAPTWRSVLAQRGAIVPHTTRLEIYDIAEAPRQPPALVAVVDEAVVLGRGGNEEGFLVESPRPDGSRWIGLAAWTTGAVRWLVQEPGIVAAFATIGPEGRLAWSQRSAGRVRYDLVVEHAGIRWRLPGQNGDWLMPTWGWGPRDPDGLFVLRLEDGRLDVTHCSAATEDTMRRTIELVPVATQNATIETAFQAVTAQPHSALPPRWEDDQFIFFHPTRLRVALWRPPAPPQLLDSTSLAAVIDPDDPGHVILSMPDKVVRARLDSDRVRNRLLEGMHVPRATGSAHRPLILTQPLDHEIGLTAMHLLPR